MTLNFFKTVPNSNDYNTKIDFAWNLTNQQNIGDFLNDNPDHNFKKMADVVKADNKSGYDFAFVNEEARVKEMFVYLLVINGKIIKGGSSKNTLKKRGYTIGTEMQWTATHHPADHPTKAGNVMTDPSATNYTFSQIFRSCVKREDTVEFYYTTVPVIIQEFNVFGEIVSIPVSPFVEYEKILNKKLKNDIAPHQLVGEGDLNTQIK